MKTIEFKEALVLDENEYLLKIRMGYDDLPGTGFLTKLNKDGSLPKAFENWNSSQYGKSEKLPIRLVTENFKPGWKIYNFRIGESQQWAKMIHPDNYTIEIYLSNYLEISKNITIVNGELIGEFKYADKKLIKK